MAGLNIPGISEYLLLCAAIWLLFRCLADLSGNDKSFFTTLGLLFLFAVSYYSFTYIHGITGLNESVRNILTIIGSYGLGYSLCARNTPSWPRGLLIPLGCMVAGFVTFSFLCVHSLLSSADIIQIAERNAFSIWDGREINAPGLGANASLGMCLLPTVLFGKDDQFKGYFCILVTIFIAFLFAAGIYVNVALQNRTPFLATAAALFFGALFYLHRHKMNPSKAVKKLAILCGLAGLLIYYLANSLELTQFNILVRFTEQQLESARYETWQTMLTSLHHSLLGGRVVRLGEESYVHNLWLDVFWDAGFAPFVFLVIFHLKHAACFKKILGSKLPLLVTLMIAGLGTSFFMNFAQEPTLSASVPYFAASCFFLGLLSRLSQETEREKDLP